MEADLNKKFPGKAHMFLLKANDGFFIAVISQKVKATLGNVFKLTVKDRVIENDKPVSAEEAASSLDNVDSLVPFVTVLHKSRGVTVNSNDGLTGWERAGYVSHSLQNPIKNIIQRPT